MVVNQIYFYCKKQNILGNLPLYRKTIFLDDYDNTSPGQYNDFVCNGFHNEHNNNYNYVPYSIQSKQIFSFDKSKEALRRENGMNHKHILFLQIMDLYSYYMNVLDRLLLALQNKDIHVILYYPYKETDIIDENVILKIHDINIDETISMLKQNISSYMIIDSKITEAKLCEYIYLSDIYIPICNEFCILTLFAQRCKTYCLFLNDNYTSIEYCMYGDNPIMQSEDKYYNITGDRIERVLRVDDISKSIQEYIDKKDCPFFSYKREIAALLF
jgi:hypothetical protein